MPVHIPFDNSYARLPSSFYSRVLPSSAHSPRLIKLNHALAQQLGLEVEELDTPEGIEVLAGKRLPAGADPIATAYAASHPSWATVGRFCLAR